ncbi:hypothetical protein [Collinsella sp. Sow4_E3]|jgi:hypothetical protein|uniref:hypothetical protein n=1 Tax=Collinsella sp. Sow4_E3 TaxID=3438776 RepID=UPI003F901E0A
MSTTTLDHKALVAENKAAGRELPQYTPVRPLEYKLKTDAKGTTRARFYSFRAHRSFGISLAVVRQLEAEGRAVEVPFLVTDPMVL